METPLLFLLLITSTARAQTLKGLNDISTSSFHVCAAMKNPTVNNSVICWGSFTNNFNHQPNFPAGSGEFNSITTNNYHTCALDAHSHAHCAGINLYSLKTSFVGGQVMNIPGGDCDSSCRSNCYCTSTTVEYTALGAGRHHSCGLAVDKSIKCWGWDFHGQVRNIPYNQGTSTPTTLGATPVPTSSRDPSVCKDNNTAMVARWKADFPESSLNEWPALACRDLLDQCDLPIYGPYVVAALCPATCGVCHIKPQNSLSLLFLQLAVGNFHNCAVTAAQDVECWGEDYPHGQSKVPQNIRRIKIRPLRCG